MSITYVTVWKCITYFSKKKSIVSFSFLQSTAAGLAVEPSGPPIYPAFSFRGLHIWLPLPLWVAMFFPNLQAEGLSSPVAPCHQLSCCCPVPSNLQGHSTGCHNFLHIYKCQGKSSWPLCIVFSVMVCHHYFYVDLQIAGGPCWRVGSLHYILSGRNRTSLALSDVVSHSCKACHMLEFRRWYPPRCCLFGAFTCDSCFPKLGVQHPPVECIVLWI